MNTNEILEAIDQEILKLQQVRVLLAEAPAIQAAKPSATPATGKRRGRPKGSVNKKSEVTAPIAKKQANRVMSAEGKARIAAAQKSRWAAQEKFAAKKVAAKPRKNAVAPARTATKTPTSKTVAAKISKKAVVAAKRTVAAAPSAIEA